MRHSGGRAAVLTWIAAAERPFTAEMIVQQLVVPQRVSRPTIYRTVDWLRTAGWLLRLHGEAVDRFYVRAIPGCYQVVCTGCGSLRAILALDLRSQSLEVYGMCQTCRAYAHETV